MCAVSDLFKWFPCLALPVTAGFSAHLHAGTNYLFSCIIGPFEMQWRAQTFGTLCGTPLCGGIAPLSLRLARTCIMLTIWSGNAWGSPKNLRMWLYVERYLDYTLISLFSSTGQIQLSSEKVDGFFSAYIFIHNFYFHFDKPRWEPLRKHWDKLFPFIWSVCSLTFDLSSI